MVISPQGQREIQYPTIATLLDRQSSPQWSVMITAYNRTDYLERAILSVLEQGFTADEMQIEVVDDCSTQGDIAAVVEQIGQGRVTYYRQPVNLGIFANWNTCIQRSQGRWIHILSDDDAVMPGFYAAYQKELEQQDAMVAIAPSVYVDEYDRWTGITESLQPNSGILENALWKLASQNPIRTPGIVVARQAYEQVGGFTTDLIFTPDWEMWARLATAFPIAYLNRPYSLFRMHSSSETSRLNLTDAAILDSLAASTVIQTHFADPTERDRVKVAIDRWLSQESLRLSRQLVHSRHYRSALRHAFWVLKLTFSGAALLNLLRVLLKIIKVELASKIHSSPRSADRQKSGQKSVQKIGAS
jgi:cellulose synthase/poly-beta-1,6-N-acetylglucosamine synthase-like glycosyltransferase